jgi:hypothetical protein
VSEHIEENSELGIKSGAIELQNRTEAKRLKNYGALIGLVVGVVFSISLLVLDWSDVLNLPVAYPLDILLMLVMILICMIACYYTPNKWGI